MKMPTVLTFRKFVTKILSFKILFSAWCSDAQMQSQYLWGGGRRIRSSLLPSKFKANLGYMRACLKQTNKKPISKSYHMSGPLLKETWERTRWSRKFMACQSYVQKLSGFSRQQRKWNPWHGVGPSARSHSHRVSVDEIFDAVVVLNHRVDGVARSSSPAFPKGQSLQTSPQEHFKEQLHLREEWWTSVKSAFCSTDSISYKSEFLPGDDGKPL